MADFDTLPPALRPIVTNMQTRIDAITGAMLNGDISPTEWQNQMSVLIAQHHTAALRAGQEDRFLSPEAEDFLQSLIGVQVAFLANFTHVIRTAGPNLEDFANRFRARALSYSLAVKTAYSMGDIIRQVGRPLPLPAMPAQGTQCGNNCLCKWRIEPIDAAAGDFDCYWERHADDSCQTCVARAELWNPIRIRGGRLIVDYSLKHLAGQHDQQTHGRGLSLDEVHSIIKPKVSRGGIFRGISKEQYGHFLKTGRLTSDGRHMTAGKRGDLHATGNLMQAIAHADGGVLLEFPKRLTRSISGLGDIRRVSGDVLNLSDVLAVYDASTGESLQGAGG